MMFGEPAQLSRGLLSFYIKRSTIAINSQGSKESGGYLGAGDSHAVRAGPEAAEQRGGMFARGPPSGTTGLLAGGQEPIAIGREVGVKGRLPRWGTTRPPCEKQAPCTLVDVRSGSVVDRGAAPIGSCKLLPRVPHREVPIRHQGGSPKGGERTTGAEQVRVGSAALSWASAGMLGVPILTLRRAQLVAGWIATARFHGRGTKS